MSVVARHIPAAGTAASTASPGHKQRGTRGNTPPRHPLAVDKLSPGRYAASDHGDGEGYKRRSM
ncbi:hypothetical protein FA09DRAFT_328773 [Tilletiopsis washingtonensis]|uniref:Uncharacterized protein n=1 Tax=Tilletiopsis washingtonensis TaxID=58919 RepID=A0A316ZG93_9BASI|nr:hypothetical protein FA09DRAFT_328773 [Tilletiopsis washingtonensis]PWN99375.1 hypothetical protein FA09DRAFT_328773 [Tilletiopsis washingtonensis]